MDIFLLGLSDPRLLNDGIDCHTYDELLWTTFSN